jgi:Uma2 family endonuclease
MPVMLATLPETYRPLRRLEYEKLAALGTFEDERIELLDGVLFPMSPPAPPHSSAIDLLNVILVRALGDRARVRVQNPFAASDISEPQPDLLVAPLGDYRKEHPSEALLVIEVADSSLAIDRGRKRRIYAERGVPEYWIVDVAAERVEVYREPSDGVFAISEIRTKSDSITLLRFPDVTVHVEDVFA